MNDIELVSTMTTTAAPLIPAMIGVLRFLVAFYNNNNNNILNI